MDIHPFSFKRNTCAYLSSPTEYFIELGRNSVQLFSGVLEVWESLAFFTWLRTPKAISFVFHLCQRPHRHRAFTYSTDNILSLFLVFYLRNLNQHSWKQSKEKASKLLMQRLMAKETLSRYICRSLARNMNRHIEGAVKSLISLQ